MTTRAKPLAIASRDIKRKDLLPLKLIQKDLRPNPTNDDLITQI